MNIDLFVERKKANKTSLPHNMNEFAVEINLTVK